MDMDTPQGPVSGPGAGGAARAPLPVHLLAAGGRRGRLHEVWPWREEPWTADVSAAASETGAALDTLHSYGCGVLVLYVDRTDTGDPGVGEPIPGSAALTVHPSAPIPARAVALAALDALYRADPTRAL